jgi:hypothetical protein
MMQNLEILAVTSLHMSRTWESNIIRVISSSNMTRIAN